MAQQARARRLSRLVLLLSCLCIACARPPETAAAVSLTWNLEPAPPVAGAATTARLTIRDSQQKPVVGARLQLEGHMSHPGMAPVVAAMSERSDGVYEAPVPFTMAGDWVLVVTGEAPSVGRIAGQIEVAGVRPPS